MAEPARPFWEADELVAKAPPRKPAKGSRPFWEEDELVATKAEAKANPGIWEAIGRGALQGATLGGGDELYAAGSGALAKARGQEFGPEYDRQLAETQAANRAAKEAHPWSYALAEAAGIIPGLVYGGTTALGARALGLAGGSFLARSGAAAGSGAVIGAIQGGASAEPEERLAGTGLGAAGGALVGAASPAVGAAVGKGVGMVSEAVRSRMAPNPAGLSNSAADLLAQDLKASGGAGAVRSRLDELGPDARLLDASPSFQGRAQGLAIQPETREILVDPLTARNAGTNARLAGDLDGAVGRAPVPSRVEAQIAAAREALGPEYAEVFRGARAVDTRQLADALDTMAVNTEVQRLRRCAGYAAISTSRALPATSILTPARSSRPGRLSTVCWQRKPTRRLFAR